MSADNDNAPPLPTTIEFSKLLTVMAEAYGSMALASAEGDTARAEAFAQQYQERRIRAIEAYERAHDALRRVVDVSRNDYLENIEAYNEMRDIARRALKEDA